MVHYYSVIFEQIHPYLYMHDADKISEVAADLIGVRVDDVRNALEQLATRSATKDGPQPPRAKWKAREGDDLKSVAARIHRQALRCRDGERHPASRANHARRQAVGDAACALATFPPNARRRAHPNKGKLARPQDYSEPRGALLRCQGQIRHTPTLAKFLIFATMRSSRQILLDLPLALNPG